MTISSGYASDISTFSIDIRFSQLNSQSNRDTARTYPASGSFSTAQATLYSAVLAAQKQLITMCTESANVSLADLHRESCNLIRTELNKIGFNLHGATGAGDVERVLYPHYVGHPIGIGT